MHQFYSKWKFVMGLMAIVLLLGAGATFTHAAKPAGGIKVLDANGQELGVLVSAGGVNNGCFIDLFLPSLAVFLRLETCTLPGNPPTTGGWYAGFPHPEGLHFEDTTCSSGEPFVKVDRVGPGRLFTEVEGPAFSGRFFQLENPVAIAETRSIGSAISSISGTCSTVSRQDNRVLKVTGGPTPPFAFPVALPLQFIMK